MVSVMCWAMCTLNIAGAYVATPEHSTKTVTATPSNQLTVRPTGQRRSRVCSRHTPRR